MHEYDGRTDAMSTSETVDQVYQSELDGQTFYDDRGMAWTVMGRYGLGSGFRVHDGIADRRATSFEVSEGLARRVIAYGEADVAKPIAVGDVVRLRSGGPTMTVSSVLAPLEPGGARVMCVWFDNTRPYCDQFYICTLEQVA